MRRKDREITDYTKMLEILQGCDCIRLGICGDNGVYVVPVNFGLSEENGQLILYFHGAKEGRKIELLKKQPCVCFEADRKHEVVTGEIACGYSFLYQSIIGYGTVTFLEDPSEKEKALNCIMKHYSGKDTWEFDKAMIENTCAVKIAVSEWSCKEH